jgi:integrase
MAKATKKKLAWGEGSIRQRGNRFQVRWREGGTMRSASGFASRFEAHEELERIHARLKLGQPGVEPKAPPKPASREFADLLDEWIDYRVKHDKRMALEERSRWALHLAVPLATQTVDTVTSKWVRNLAVQLVKPEVGDKAPNGKRKEPISGPTAQRVLTLLSSFYTWAVDEGIATDNPARAALRHKDVKKLLASKHDGKMQPYLKSWELVTALYNALAPPYSIAYLIGARAGLRPGEVVALQWSDVDFAAGTLLVERQVRSGKLGPTKGGRARTVPLSPALAEVLKKWKPAKARSGDLVCPPAVRMRKNGKPGARYGMYLGPKRFTTALAAAFKVSGIAPGTLYQYGRHTFGSLTALGGVSTWRLKEWMGHQDISTTERYVSLVGQQLTPAELVALGG